MVKNPACPCRRRKMQVMQELQDASHAGDTRCKTQEMQVKSLGREDPLEEDMATHSVLLPGEFHGQRSIVGYSP